MGHVALFSVIIASVAQLSLGFRQSSAADDALMGFYRGSVSFWPGCPDTVTRAAGLIRFRFLFGTATLHKLALSKAYALLSMSYVLVWIASWYFPAGKGLFRQHYWE